MAEPVVGSPMRLETWFGPEEFAERRQRVFERIGDGAAVLQGAGPLRGFALFRQTNEFLYLTGLEAPQAYALLDGAKGTATAFLPNRPEKSAEEETLLYVEDGDRIRAATGLDEVLPWSALESRLRGCKRVFTPLAPVEGAMSARDVLQHAAKVRAPDPMDGGETRQSRFVARLRALAPDADIVDLSPILDEMRLIKSPAEVAVMRYAGKLAAQAVAAAMALARPGLREYDLHAEMSRVFLAGGARCEGYRAIIPSGVEHTWDGHYMRNDGPLLDGHMVLMDCAPDVCNYTSDIGRMFPVNGRFAPWQRELYGFVVRYHRAIMSRVKPGVLPADALKDAAEEMAEAVGATRWSKPCYEEAARKALEFRGHYSHPVGMAVHDVGRYFDRPFEPGLVFSLDPQLWVREERLYIRCEDTGVVTADGFEPFTSGAPLDLDEVEATVGTRA